MAEAAKTAPETKPQTSVAQTAAAPKVKAEPKPPRFNPKGTISFLADAKDATKKYGPDNNPKRAGTKAHTAFSNYAEGITIEALAAKFEKSGGSMNANLDWDIKHNYIRYDAPKA